MPEHLPDEMRDGLGRHWQALCEQARQSRVVVPSDPGFLAVLFRVWDASEFVAESCARDPSMLADLLDQGDLHRAYVGNEYAARLDALLQGVNSDDDLGWRLRRFRRREMVRIAWRDLAGWAELNETLAELSLLAGSCIEAALSRIDQWMCDLRGEPRSAAGRRQRMVVIGMGKLGAFELNFSSDIDLVFAFPEEGETSGRMPVDNEQYFSELAQRVVNALNRPTRDGYVFRVDLRLRPYGDSGPVVMNFEAMEEYYETQARDWERYAFVKARPVAGDLEAGQRLMQMLRPFVYRRYLDYGSFDSLRCMKQMIEREMKRKGMRDNVKLGAGGIREIEFIVQAWQLVRGGRDVRLQERRLQLVLQHLVEGELLPEYAGAELQEAYAYLRRVENRLQEFEDKQTHLLPEREGPRGRLARNMGFDDWDDFVAELDSHRGKVQRQFERVFAAPQAGQDDTPDELRDVWEDHADHDDAGRILAQAGYRKPEAALELLARFRESYPVRALTDHGGMLLGRLMPLLLGAAGGSSGQEITLERTLKLLENIAQRSAYLSLLVENPMALSQLVRLADASPWIVHQLSRQPALFDELLDPRHLYAPQDRDALAAELNVLVRDIGVEDLEQQMEVLRRFAQAARLRVAAADLAGVSDVEAVSSQLTVIAELVLATALDFATRQMQARYGEPVSGKGRKARPLGFAVVAYGKLGGRELNYGSDLDLVFLHETFAEGSRTRGAEKIDCNVYFARLGQRLIHMLSTLTPSGILYEVDMRLRPSGASGMLVSDLESFERYQQEDAWTWEHQALVRARMVAGDAVVADAFDGIRRQILARKRSNKALKADICDMREKMREQLTHTGKGEFDVKQGVGGVADIEFMVQFAVLSSANRFPGLCDHTGNGALLAALAEAGVIKPVDCVALDAAYRDLSAVLHHCTLREQPARVPDSELAVQRRAVTRLWKKLLQSG